MNEEMLSEGGYSNLNPILIIGIVLMVIPTITTIAHYTMPGWASGACRIIGLIGILVGAVMSIMSASQN